MLKLGMPTLMEFETVQENIEIAKSLELDFVELNINMLYCYPTPKFRYEMLRFKDQYKIDFTMHYYDTVDVSSPNRNYQDYLFKDMNELGYSLNGIVNRLIMHIEPGAFMTIFSEKRYVYKYDLDYVYRTIDNLKKTREILERYNIEMVLENVPIHTFMEPLYKALGEENFNFCWDIGHDVIYNDFLFSKFREKYNLQVKHMHIHNVLDGGKDHQSLDVGILDIPAYIDFAQFHDCHVVIEVKDLSNFKSSIEYLKSIPLKMEKDLKPPKISIQNI